AKLVVLRLLGGQSYWAYGLEELAALCREKHILLAVLPGDPKPDPGLQDHSTLDGAPCQKLHDYLNEGGPENARNFLLHCAHLLGKSEAPSDPAPFLKAGLYWPGTEKTSLDDVQSQWRDGAPIGVIVFYRALLQGNSLAPVNALVEALVREGLNPLPVFVSSLKEDISIATIARIFAQAKPDVILNCTGFAVSTPGKSRVPSPLDGPGCPVLQVIFSGSGEASWRASSQGLGSRDLAMNVALPEVDGRILSRAVSFKSDTAFDEKTQTRIVTYQPLPDRIVFTAKLARAWTLLSRTKPENRKLAIVLANYPNRDGRIGNGVGLDTPASTIHLMETLRETGYDISDIPADGDRLIELLQQGQTNRIDGATRASDAQLSLDRYKEFFSTLPGKIRKEITARWGDPTDDPFVDNGSFQLPVKAFGNVIVGIQPARGYNI
ncbi:MAG: cobaltochelatase subunit CobN, partial [Fimbriimonadaceae bacterium]|nr:cobaltochelatase subunit CobN [Alphaproteobacteria bacterium]